MAENKTKITKASPREYILSIKDEGKKKDGLSLLKLFKEITGEPARLWSNNMISFGTYHYKSERSSQEGDWPLTAFSVRKQNITVYVMLGMQGFAQNGDLLKKLGKHKKSGGSCLYINKLEDVDMAILKKIIKHSYLAMKKKYKA